MLALLTEVLVMLRVTVLGELVSVKLLTTLLVGIDSKNLRVLVSIKSGSSWMSVELCSAVQDDRSLIGISETIVKSVSFDKIVEMWRGLPRSATRSKCY